MSFFLLLVIAIPVLLIAAAVGLFVAGQRRIAGAVLVLPCLIVAAFCGFGFLSSFEPGVSIAWKIGYAVLGLGFLTGAGGGIVMMVIGDR